jgi:hypothetical protein
MVQQLGVAILPNPGVTAGVRAFPQLTAVRAPC